MKCDKLTPIELECNMGIDSVTGLVNREPWKAYDIDEVDAYTRQLENEVDRWHHAYDALMIERNQLVGRIMELERKIKQQEDK